MHIEIPILFVAGTAASAFLASLLPAPGVPGWFRPAVGAWAGASIMLGLALIGLLCRLVEG